MFSYVTQLCHINRLDAVRQVSLFLDVLKCLCSDLTQDQFVSEDRVGCSSAVGPRGAAVRSGRTELWRILRGAPLSLGGCILPLLMYCSLLGAETGIQCFMVKHKRVKHI